MPQLDHKKDSTSTFSPFLKSAATWSVTSRLLVSLQLTPWFFNGPTLRHCCEITVSFRHLLSLLLFSKFGRKCWADIPFTNSWKPAKKVLFSHSAAQWKQCILGVRQNQVCLVMHLPVFLTLTPWFFNSQIVRHCCKEIVSFRYLLILQFSTKFGR